MVPLITLPTIDDRLYETRVREKSQALINGRFGAPDQTPQDELLISHGFVRISRVFHHYTNPLEAQIERFFRDYGALNPKWMEDGQPVCVYGSAAKRLPQKNFRLVQAADAVEQRENPGLQFDLYIRFRLPEL